MFIGNKRREWVSTLTFPFIESNKKIITLIGSDDEVASIGLETVGFWCREYT